VPRRKAPFTLLATQCDHWIDPRRPHGRILLATIAATSSTSEMVTNVMGSAALILKEFTGQRPRQNGVHEAEANPVAPRTAQHTVGTNFSGPAEE